MYLFFLGPFWEKLNEEMFTNLSFHTIDPEEEEKKLLEKKQAEEEEMAAKIRARLKADKKESEDL